MSDAPEQIWLGRDERYQGEPWIRLTSDFDEECETQEYIRADLAAPDMAELVEALRECHDALRDHAKMYPQMVKGFTHDAEKRAAAALAKIKEAT